MDRPRFTGLTVIVVAAFAIAACVIDPIPGKVEIFVDGDSTDYLVDINADYKDFDKSVSIEAPATSRDFTSWHTDVYEYSAHIDNRDPGTTIAVHLHITYPNEYEYKDLYF